MHAGHRSALVSKGCNFIAPFARIQQFIIALFFHFWSAVNSVLVTAGEKVLGFHVSFKLLHIPTNAASIDLDLKPYILYMLFVFVVVDITQHIHTKV